MVDRMSPSQLPATPGGGLLKTPAASSPAARATMRANRRRDTAPERSIRSSLHRSGLRFRKHVRPVPSLRCLPDIVFTRDRLVVFIDGCFWHGCEAHCRLPRTNREYWESKIGRNVARDRRNDERLADAGWAVVRCWEHEDTEAAAARIRAALTRRRHDLGRLALPVPQ
jgi:DNA mismatch endonuclease (patch repair protein)